jgi:alpha-tubulin suppressor-like RCC1 family protein
MEDLKCITEQMSNYFKDNVKLLFISKFNVIIVTKKEDNVYEFERKFGIYIKIGSGSRVSDIEKQLITWKEEDSIFDTLIEKSKLKELCDKNVVDFKNGRKHVVALTSDGNVFSWGLNAYGILGNGREQNRETIKPKLIEKASHQKYKNNIKDICCGAYHTLALTKDGDVFAWGFNIYGQIGNRVWDENKKNNKNALIPTKVEGFKDKIRAISCGAMFSMALTINGCVYIWGHVSDDIEIILKPEQKQQCNRPKEVIIDENILIEKISCGREHYLLLSSENFIYVFGRNEFAQLGVGHREEVSAVVKLENPSLNFQEIAAHPEFDVSAAISSDNSCHIWGLIGIGRFMCVTEPKECLFESFAEIFEEIFQITFNSHEIPLSSMSDKFIELNHNQQIISYKSAHDPGTIFKPIGSLESYGNLSEKLNEYFKDNLKFSFVSRDTVMIVTLGDDVYEFKRTTNNSFMHIIEGELFTHMKNAIIALSESFSTIEPLVEKSKVKELCNKNIVEFKNGSEHMIARSFDGDVYCWGRNYNGLLGKNQLTDFLFHRPELINLPNDENTSNKIEEICCGLRHTIVRTEEGDVNSWGQNYWGQCGNFIMELKIKVKQLSDLEFENYDQKYNRVVLSPIKVNGFNSEKVKSISCGEHHSLALTTNGHVFFWGYLGEKHDYLTTEEHRECSEPKVIFEYVLFEKISCGQYHCLLLSKDKNIYGFGLNNWAQLGLGFSGQFEPSPIQLNFSSKMIDIAAHPLHNLSAALSEKGDYYVWGFSRGRSVDRPTKVRLKSFEEIFEENLEISYKTNKESLIKFRNDFIRNDYFERLFISIHREKPGFINSGAFGEVFKVETLKCFYDTNIFAAKKIKFFKTDQNDKMYKSFLKELGTSSSIVKLNHVNVVKYFDA